MNFLVTGASGFIGSNLARVAASRGHQVRALVRPSSIRTALSSSGVTFAVGDLFTGEGLANAVEGVDCVLHLAGATKARSAEDFYRCNTEGTQRLIEAAARLSPAPRFVYCSSLSAAGPSAVDRPRSETDDPRPVSAYGRSKLAAEMAIRKFADRVPCIIVRPPIVYGPWDKEFLPALLPMARLGWVLKSGFGPKRYSLIHVDDLCEALLSAASQGKSLSPDDPGAGVYFLSDGRDYSWEEFCLLLARALGKPPPHIIPLPEAASYAAGLAGQLQGLFRGRVPMMSLDKARELRCSAWTCSAERAKSEIAYRPTVPLEKGLHQTIEWYRKEGWI